MQKTNEMMDATHKRQYMVDIWKDVEEVPYTGFPSSDVFDDHEQVFGGPRYVPITKRKQEGI